MNGLAIHRRRPSSDSLTVRDAVAPVFRHRRLALAIFIGVFGGAAIAAAITPAKYEAAMKILVNRDRADDVVTPNPDTRIVSAQVPPVTEQDLNSEVELLKSRDLLRNVALACNLELPATGFWQSIAEKWISSRNPELARRRRIEDAVDALESRVIAEPLKNTSLIRVSYTSPDPQLAAGVLHTLATFYQEKHAEVHRPAGAFRFFQREADYYSDQLVASEARLQHFDTATGLVIRRHKNSSRFSRSASFRRNWTRIAPEFAQPSGGPISFRPSRAHRRSARRPSSEVRRTLNCWPN